MSIVPHCRFVRIDSNSHDFLVRQTTGFIEPNLLRECLKDCLRQFYKWISNIRKWNILLKNLLHSNSLNRSIWESHYISQVYFVCSACLKIRKIIKNWACAGYQKDAWHILSQTWFVNRWAETRTFCHQV